MNRRILVVDDDPAARYGARRLLGTAGHEVVEAASGEEALALLRGRTFDAALLDYQMPGMDGLETLRRLQEVAEAPPVVLFTAQGSEKVAVAAMRAGAHDYLVKPADADELILVLERACAFGAARRENERLREEVEAARPGTSMLGDSPALRRVRDDLERMAPAPSSVLLLGESGTGKEVAARFLHERSGRTGPFVAVNCGALPATLVEGELFGHEKGAFTGAVQSRPGKVRQAEGGTLFLDEIGDMPLEAQVRLLRVLEDRTVEPLGGNAPVAVDIRVVAATHRDLRARVAEGRFREDLFYRLDVLTVHLPPLRERPEDVLTLARSFLARFAGRRRMEFSPAAERALRGYRWPGNARELRNVVERACVLSRDGRIGPESLGLPGGIPSAVAAPEAFEAAPEAAEAPAERAVPVVPAPSPRAEEPARGSDETGWIQVPAVAADLPFREAKAQVVEEFERRYLRHHLERCEGNVSRAAQALDMHRQSLQQKLRDLGLRGGSDEEPAG